MAAVWYHLSVDKAQLPEYTTLIKQIVERILVCWNMYVDLEQIKYDQSLFFVASFDVIILYQVCFHGGPDKADSIFCA